MTRDVRAYVVSKDGTVLLVGPGVATRAITPPEVRALGQPAMLLAAQYDHFARNLRDAVEAMQKEGGG